MGRGPITIGGADVSGFGAVFRGTWLTPVGTPGPARIPEAFSVNHERTNEERKLVMYEKVLHS